MLIQGVANINGSVVPASEAKIPVLDRGLLYGDGVFEGIRYINGKVLLHNEHRERLFRSARLIRLPELSTERYERELWKTIDASGTASGYLRVVVTRGPGAMGIGPRGYTEAHLYIIATQIALYPEQVYEDGIRLCVSKVRKIPFECQDCSVKSINYISNMMALWEAIDAGADEALMLTTDGFVSEAAVENIFGVQGNTLFTPAADTNCLIGTTRNKMIELAHESGFSVREGRFTPDEFTNAEEVFLTGTGAGILPVTAIDQKQIGSGKMGEKTRKLRALYEARIETFCASRSDFHPS